MYIWQRDDWPLFFYDEKKINSSLMDVIEKKAFLLGKFSALTEQKQRDSFISSFESEVVSSSLIEDVKLDRVSVRSSLLKNLNIDTGGINKYDHQADGFVNALLDAIEHYDDLITKETLCSWHSELFPSSFSQGRRILTGTWRKGEMYVVSGRIGKEVVHFEAPPAEKIDYEMNRFLKFLNEDTSYNLIIKAAIVHLYFVTIHPFSDGNGRIARILTEKVLSQSDKTIYRPYSLSSEILNNRDEYYNVIEYSQKSSMDATEFVLYFLKTLSKAIDTSLITWEKTKEKTDFWDSIKLIPFNERQIKIINKLLDNFEGKLTADKWSKINKCSHSTAVRDINDLIDKKVIKADGKKDKNVGYVLNIKNPLT